MFSAELARLRDTFEGWSVGKPYPTAEAWHQFQRDLRELTKNLAAQEAGVDLAIINAIVQAAQPGSNVSFLPVERMRRRDGGAK
jgi:sugar phosphate isomerase/epimerase